ncbi:MAG: DNA gyrase inhibitor YacG [Methylotenera sp. 24-45-7]|nr:MAG: DNA gyrase inhibitor YacG [Mehylophilales bacterium 35-46-6]OYY83145.1 MAG: DNA gyrase inhibitor YacG [Methylophilales bacterium 16-45-9]OYZ40126.1 MAG: DNA gyrase inhibitor YacG [Methylotenera sp. 24-45-7]OZA53254.1 MAG: DNA gyrase inhibitor YacG [Methylophilales bacterium 39-45-7]HQS37214.1 DNA gyrase inhibitor YacG [Methylotenera sp.]
MTSIKKRLIACPTCKQLTEYSLDNAYRPFCSKRCKLIDLGLWASEQYAIPVEMNVDDLEDNLPTQQ